MKIFLTISIVLLAYYAQSQSCYDSNMIMRYHSTSDVVTYNNTSDVIPTSDGGNLSWGGSKPNANNVYDYSCIFKTDSISKIKWETKLSIANRFLNGVHVIETDNKRFLITGNAVDVNNIVSEIFFLAEIDDNGTLLWSHFYQMSILNGISNGVSTTKSITRDAIGNIYKTITYNNLYELFPDRNHVAVVAKFSPDGLLIWNRAFVPLKDDEPLGLENIDVCQIFASNDTLTLFSFSNSASPYVTMQLKTEDASLVRVKAFNPVNYAVFPSAANATKLANGNYVFSKPYTDNLHNDDPLAAIDFSTVVFNNNLDPIKEFQIKTFPPDNQDGWGGRNKNMVVSPSGEMMYGISRSSENSMYYGLIDVNGSILQQKRIQYFNPTDGNFYIPPLSYYKNNRLFVRTTNCESISGNCNLDYISFDKDISKTNSCISVHDTSFMQIVPFSLQPVEFKWDYTEDNVLHEQPIQLIQQPTIFTEEEVCKEISVCDTPKIKGDDKICGFENENLFYANKSSQCLKTINWSIDSTSIKSLRVVDDTTFGIRFNNKWSGYLHSSIGGTCNLKDSFFINVFSSSKISIGNDTALCPNTTDTLRTKFSYQKYLWQDGSTDSFFVVKQSGLYKLTATDMCDNISADSVQIKYDDSKLTAGMDIDLCKLQDTSFTASNGFADYQWQPANEIIGSSLSQTIRIAPSLTTDYIVSAESALGCIFSDTVKAVVNNCLNRLIVPTAFSPNNDGKNETLKPIVYGILQKYDFSIYNRWGQLVFHSSKQGEGWDGKINRIVQNDGAYVWFCRYQFSGEKEKHDKGTFLLIK